VKLKMLELEVERVNDVAIEIRQADPTGCSDTPITIEVTPEQVPFLIEWLREAALDRRPDPQ